MKELAITAVNCITAVGHDAAMTAAAVRAGISRFSEFEEYPDGNGNPITVARIKGIEDGKDTVERMAETARLCLESLLDRNFPKHLPLPSNPHLFLGVASDKRPGPCYEESCFGQLIGIMENRTNKPSIETVPLGNAAMQNAVAQAGKLIESNPDAMCIVGCIDSLLRHSTLNWFEQAGRLKSVSYGRHQGLIAGEAACFLIVEDPARAEQAGRPVLARIAGLGLADEPALRAERESSLGTGLSDACRAALAGVSSEVVRAVFGDLNGENVRALEWSIAERRCFKKGAEGRQLWNPANCYGDVGAASGALLTIVAVQGFIRKWLKGPVLIFCSDDHGSCGATVLCEG
ncbi:MAG: 3-oxoacyl-ACP synthase [Geobacteraceae bacterium]|nr:3-oxoacyl-ACP synthase [Geobacteraceae bacterium]